MQKHTDSWEKIDKNLQQYSHVFNGTIICYIEGLVISKL
jgi:hypothetical protein